MQWFGQFLKFRTTENYNYLKFKPFLIFSKKYKML